MVSNTTGVMDGLVIHTSDSENAKVLILGTEHKPDDISSMIYYTKFNYTNILYF